MMEEICRFLGPRRVSCLTGVRADAGNEHPAKDIRVYRRPNAFIGNNYFQAIPLAWSLLDIILRERPHVLQLSVCHEGYIGLLVKRWFRLPYIMYAHGSEILSAMHTNWEKQWVSLRQADCILANSRFTAGLVEKTGVRPEAIRVIPLGCDILKFRPREPDPEVRRKYLGARADAPVILTVGGLIERKGQDMVIKALPTIRKSVPEVTYLVVGSGYLRKDLEDMALSLGVRDHVVFTGKIADDELPHLYAMSDVFAMPSRTQLEHDSVEGFGLVYLEAGASGKPVVAGRSGGVEEAVVDGGTGLLVDPTESEDVAKALIRLLSDRELRGRLGNQGYERVRKEYTWDIVGRHVMEILSQVVDKGKRQVS
jgi:phosphatidylinositol alpha-1,6-mannosyltransferase